MAIAFRTAGERAILAGRDHIGAVLDGAGAIENMPMGPAGDAGEGRGHRQHLGAGLGERAIERGEAQVVADRKPDRSANARRQDGFRARHDGGGFAIAMAITQIDIEQMNLVVARSNRAIRRQHVAAIENSAVNSLNPDRADKDPGFVHAREFRHGRQHRVITLRHGKGMQHSILGVEPCAIFGKRNEFSAL